MSRVAPCARCTRVRQIRYRGVCASCGVLAERDGTIHDFPRERRTLADFAEDFKIIIEGGATYEQVAARLGYRPGSSLRNAIKRAIAAGLLPSTVRIPARSPR